MLQLSAQAARDLLLAAQGLRAPVGRAAGKGDVLAAIRRMEVLQIDTINVVARSPYLVLWSRLGPFEMRWLDALLAEGALFEYWSHAACFLPIEDFPLTRRRMLDEAGGSRVWTEENAALCGRILDRIGAQGATRSAHWERAEGRTTGWWDWKPEKQALEHLFNEGTLMVARREQFQRLYDLRERVLPGWDDARTPAREEARRALVLKAVRALGVTRARWVPDYFRMPVAGVQGVLDDLEAEGAVVRVAVEGWAAPGYVHADHLEAARQAASGDLASTVTTLLSPFDPIVWDRARVAEMFDFVYRIEVYTPAARRKYGYFSLPILHRGALVGRLDPKAHRKEGVLQVRALHLEPGVVVTEELRGELRAALEDFAGWQGLGEVVVCTPNPVWG